jgi:hypothetical protein
MTFARIIAKIILILVFLATGLFAAEIALRLTVGHHFAPLQPCLRFGNPRVHHLYIANCHVSANQMGLIVSYEFNQVGLRERSLSDLQPKKIVVLGDSEVKGLYAPVEESLSRVFERTIPGEVSFVNMGVRFTGPTVQGAIFRYLQPKVAARGVVWFLNGGDPMEERYFIHKVSSRSGFGVPNDFTVDADQYTVKHPAVRLSRMFGGKIELFNFWYRTALFRDWRDLAVSTPPDDEVLCGGIRALASQLKHDHIPLLFVFAPKIEAGVAWGWLGEAYDPSQLQRMVACARETGQPVIDLSNEKLGAEKFYPDGVHFRLPAAEWITDRIAPELSRIVDSLEDRR